MVIINPLSYVEFLEVTIGICFEQIGCITFEGVAGYVETGM